MRAVIIEQFGNEDVLQIKELATPLPESGEVLVQVAWAGLNFVDIYFREGRYPGAAVPMSLGIEATGIVAQAGVGSEFRAGDRVAFTTGVLGCYAEQIAVPEQRLIRIPDGISLQQACAGIEHGLTADMLVNDVARLAAAHTVLVHAAAGGVGGMLVQMLMQKGLRVIGTVSSQEKADWLTERGVHAVRYDNDSDWLAEVTALTEGHGVDVVFDSVGQSTFLQSLDALAVRGHMVLFGAASGVVEPVSPTALMKKSLTLTRPVLTHFVDTPAKLCANAARLFEAWQGGEIEIRIDSVFPLAEVANAHRRLASRQAQGKILLRVGTDD